MMMNQEYCVFVDKKGYVAEAFVLPHFICIAK